MSGSEPKCPPCCSPIPAVPLIGVRDSHQHIVPPPPPPPPRAHAPEPYPPGGGGGWGRDALQRRSPKEETVGPRLVDHYAPVVLLSNRVYLRRRPTNGCSVTR